MSTTVRSALVELVRVIDAAGLPRLAEGVELGRVSWYVKASDAMEAAQLALDPLNGEQTEGDRFMTLPENLRRCVWLLVEERQRQDAKWGGPEHDDQHSTAEFVQLVQDYAGWARVMAGMNRDDKAQRRMVQVGALAFADVERLMRAFDLQGILARPDVADPLPPNSERPLVDPEHPREGYVSDEVWRARMARGAS